jgi:hypothetical protein
MSAGLVAIHAEDLRALVEEAARHGARDARPGSGDDRAAAREAAGHGSR